MHFLIPESAGRDQSNCCAGDDTDRPVPIPEKDIAPAGEPERGLPYHKHIRSRKR